MAYVCPISGLQRGAVCALQWFFYGDTGLNMLNFCCVAQHPYIVFHWIVKTEILSLFLKLRKQRNKKKKNPSRWPSHMLPELLHWCKTSFLKSCMMSQATEFVFSCILWMNEWCFIRLFCSRTVWVSVNVLWNFPLPTCYYVITADTIKLARWCRRSNTL